MTEITIDEAKLTRLKDKVVFITGGARGLGLATAKVFQRLGSKVIVGDLQIPDLRENDIEYVQCDITDWSSLSTAIRTTVQKYGSLDVFVANAGVGEVEDFFYDDCDGDGNLLPPKHSVVDVNLKGTMNSVKIAMHWMRKQSSGGAIVMTASSAAYTPEKKIPAYAAAKHGIIGLLRCLRPSVSQFNITINAVAPWMAESNLLHDTHRKIMADVGVELNDPDNVGKATAYLAGSGVNGMSVWCGRNVFAELEGPLAELRPQWLGAENSAALDRAHRWDFFNNKSNL